MTTEDAALLVGARIADAAVADARRVMAARVDDGES